MKNIITEVSIYPIKPKYGHIAFASFVLFESLYVGLVAVYTRPTGGIRLVYPRKKNMDVCHPINNDLGALIQEEVEGAMEKLKMI